MLSVSKLEFGGGTGPRKGFFNVDILPTADLVFDLNTLSTNKLPIADQSVDEFYSSHCFEHLENLHGAINEVARVLKDGALAEIRVPHWASAMASCLGHVHTLSDHQVKHWYEFQNDWWSTDRFLSPVSFIYVPSQRYGRAVHCFPKCSPLDIVTLFQDTCHEIRFLLRAGPRKHVDVNAIRCEVKA